MERIKTELVVVGGGPGGYAAAFYAADRGQKVILIEKDRNLGGVCLNRGCIPSKALLHATRMIEESRASVHRGITYPEPQIDLDKLRAWKSSVLEKLAGGVSQLAKARGVEIMHGRGYFEDSKTLRVETPEGQHFISYDHAIIAVGSKAALPSVFDLGNPRVMTSTGALEIDEIPASLLIIGGGYIGMELGTVYASLGSQVTVAEALPRVMTGADPDLTRPVLKYLKDHFKEIRTGAKVQSMATQGKQIKVVMEYNGQKLDELYDKVLVSIGRVPNCIDIGLENTKVQQDEKGFIKVNERQETSDPFIYAIGDVAGGIMLAHKASKEARVAVEVLTGEASSFENMLIPAVVYTDPEIAWCGLTEEDAKKKDIKIEVAKFPWAASGRALTYDRPDGLTKMIIDPETDRILGMGIVGHNAGELISEGVVAIEMGATARDLAESIHPHPTLSETIMECAEMYYGTSTHAIPRKKREES